MKYKTQIGKYQKAGSMPKVNEYGLTEEEMSSVRDNVRKYGISEEEAIRNKISAKEASSSWMNETMANLNGPLGEAYRKANENAQIKMQFEDLPKVKIPQLVDNNWKYRTGLDLQSMIFNINKSVSDNNALLDWYKSDEFKSGREPSNQHIRDLRNDILAGLNQRYKDFENYRQEYLNQHPDPSMEELVVRGTNPSPWDYRPDIDREERAYQHARKMSGDWAPHGIESPLKQWNEGVKNGTKIGIGTTLAISTLPMFGSEIATYGLAGGVPRIIGGFAGSAIGEKSLGFLGKKLDNAFNTKWIEPTARFAGGWIGWGKGTNLAYKGALKGTNLAMRTAANNMMRNGAYDVTFQPKRWLIGNQMQADLKLMNAGIDPIKNPISLNKLYNLAGAYNRPNPSKLITATAYKQGGIIKNQLGGLVYKPYIPEQNENKQTSSTTLSYEPEDIEDESFQVEPVRIYSKRVTEKPIVSEEPVMQEVETQIDNTRVEKPIAEGKIYKSAEKEQFKEDLYNAYLEALKKNLEVLKKKGMKEKDIEEFAKKLATQDILESNWGQSSLSKNFNFGGIKDFSGKGTVKDTTEVIDGKTVKVKQPFRKFEDIDEYVNYKINLLDKKWNVFSSDPNKYYSLIVSGKQKYATDPNYTSKLNNLYKQIWK